ncbi:translocation/assembly module TamB domain-containing protein [Algiphilus sp.]|uniref:translocation/assembly module TamB domain-containing protein n=1 Tax=Algiphilus sp. TaxID=1872431 RepID=UPI003C51D6B8
MRRAARWLGFVARLTSGVITAALLIVVFLFGWLGLTTGGLRAAVALADDIAGETFDVASVDGRLLGTLELGGIRIATPGATVTVERFRFGWIPGWLPEMSFFVRTLVAEGVTVALHETEPAPPDDRPAGPLDVLIPLRVTLADTRITDLRVTRDDATLAQVDSATLSAWAAGRRVRVESFAVDAPAYGRYSMEADVRLPKGGVEITGLSLEGAGTLTASGSLSVGGDIPLDLALDWQDLHWPAGAATAERLATSPRGSARVTGTLATPEVDADIALAPGGEIAIAGAWRGADGFEARVSWQDLQDPASADAPLWRSPSGSLEASGMPGDWRARVEAAAEVMLAADEDAGEDTALPGSLTLALDGEAHGATDHATIDRLVVDALDGSVRTSGRVAWAPEVDGTLDLALRGIDPAALAADFPGRISGTAKTRFRLPESGPDVQFDVAIADSELRGFPLALDAKGTFRESVVRIERARLRSADSTLRASGRATPPFALDLALDSPDLSQFVPDVGGQAQLTARVQGAMSQLRARVQGSARGLAAAGVSINSLGIDADVALDGATQATIKIGEVRTGGAEPVVRDALLQLDGRMSAHTLRTRATLAQGSVEAILEGAAALDARSWNGRIESLRLDPMTGRIPAWDLRAPVALALGPNRVRLEEACLDSGENAAFCVRAAVQDGAVEADYRLERFALDALSAFLPAGMRVDGGLSGSGRIRMRDGAIAELDSTIEIAPGRISVPRRPELRFGPGTLTASDTGDGRLQTALSVGVAGGELDGEATLGLTPDAALAGALDLALPSIDFVPLFTGEVLEAAGDLRANVRLGGTMGEPDIDASAELADGRLMLRTPGIDIRDISGSVATTEDDRLTLALQARSGDGEIRVDGDAALDADPLRAELSVTGSDFQAANLPEVSAWISPDLRIRVAERVEIRGTVTVPRARIEPQKFSGGGGEGPHADQVFVDDDGEVEVRTGLPVDARITLALGDAVSLTGYGLETRLAGSITVIEEPNRVTRARGALTLEEGRYDAYGQRLRIERGRIVFAGGPVAQPGLDFEAVRNPAEDITVGVRVRGTIEKPEFELFSDPPMTQNEQLSWLVLGRPPPEGGPSEGDSSALAAAALALGLSGGDWLAREIGGKIGVDEISVGAADSEDSSQARLTVGKYIGTRLYISYGVSLFQPGHIFTMRYDLGNGFSIQTEAGVESGGDLLYSHER